MILICSDQNRRNNPLPSSVKLDCHEISLSSTVKNLGVVIDHSLSFEQFVSQTCRSCYFELRKINTIRRYLTQEALKTLVCSLVLSRLDYCNSLLSGCPKSLINKLQKVQNSAARLVCRLPRSSHITPALRSLHWLPVEKRISYKLLLLTYKALNEHGPSYLSDLLQLYVPSRNLRSSCDSRLLRIPSFKRKTSGFRSFAYQASVLWNSLPHSLRHSESVPVFKSNLKTHLFRL